MILIMLFDAQMSVIYAIQEFRSPFWDAFFRFLNYFDRIEFVLVLIPAVWVGVHWRAGLKLFYVLFLSSLLNQTLKWLFAMPRPFNLDPSVGLIHLSGYGIPSGAAQTSVLLSALLISVWKSPWKWPICVGYVSLISFSRLYLGVHFPIDILGGWIVGLGLWLFVSFAMPRLEKILQAWKAPALFVLSQAVPMLAFLLVPTVSNLISSIFGAGLGIGLLINYWRGWELPLPKGKKEFFLRAAIGVLGVFLLYFLLPRGGILQILAPFLMALWVTTGSLLIQKNISSRSV